MSKSNWQEPWKLSQVEVDIICLSYGIHCESGPYTYLEIARMLDLMPETVREKKRSALRKLSKSPDMRALYEDLIQ